MVNDSKITTLAIENEAPVRVLIVEDELHIRTSLVNFLEDVGYRTLSSENAEDALEILINEPVDVVIVDVRLPKMDGNSLIVKAHQIRPDLQFLIYTGSVAYKLPQSVERLGVDPEDIFYKPLPDLCIIAKAIQRKIKKRHAENEK